MDGHVHAHSALVMLGHGIRTDLNFLAGEGGGAMENILGNKPV